MASPALQRVCFSFIMLEKPQAGVFSRLHYNTAMGAGVNAFSEFFNLPLQESLVFSSISLLFFQILMLLIFIFVTQESVPVMQKILSLAPPVCGGL